MMYPLVRPGHSRLELDSNEGWPLPPNDSTERLRGSLLFPQPAEELRKLEWPQGHENSPKRDKHCCLTRAGLIEGKDAKEEHDGMQDS
jgi:hypothetical protein